MSIAKVLDTTMYQALRRSSGGPSDLATDEILTAWIAVGGPNRGRGRVGVEVAASVALNIVRVGVLICLIDAGTISVRRRGPVYKRAVARNRDGEIVVYLPRYEDLVPVPSNTYMSS